MCIVRVIKNSLLCYTLSYTPFAIVIHIGTILINDKLQPKIRTCKEMFHVCMMAMLRFYILLHVPAKT